ncbi:MAG: HTH-type transcriptional regulator DegA [bacterium]|nr:MAG: HTH-type transcriptional regulator DegA [Candidatus Hinthialibacteria bacterium OLB16]MBV6482452.1 HTH-type transcriptional regulator DegA [bacterium]MCE7907490.1 LacI family transcriptional regulator [Candidatus Omnitrophica bacterium COP1]
MEKARVSGHRRNIRAIAEICEVSPATVSRVLNNKPDVSDQIRKKILDAIKEHNYSPRLSVSQTEILGVTLEYSRAFSSPYVSAIFESMEDTAFDLGYDLLILRNEKLRRLVDDYSIFLRRKMLSGIIILLSKIEDTFPVDIAQAGFPHMVIGNRFDPPVNWIGGDCYTGMYEATRYLISLGHSRIAYIRHSPLYWDNQQRVRGYRDALEQANIPFAENMVRELVGEDVIAAAYNTLNNLFYSCPGITALITPNWDMLGIYECLREHGLRIPDDISVVALDDSPDMEHASPSITTVAQRIQQMGEFAVREVVKQIESPEEAAKIRRVVLPTELIIRESTRPLNSGVITASAAHN